MSSYSVVGYWFGFVLLIAALLSLWWCPLEGTGGSKPGERWAVQETRQTGEADEGDFGSQ